MNPLEHAFHLEEYKQIRTESGLLLARVEILFRYSLLVAATVYAWLIAQSVGLTEKDVVCLKLPVSLLKPGWIIPPAFILLSGALAFAAYWRINQMGTYLKSIESALGNSSLGWEKYLQPLRPVVTGTTVLIWLLLFGASIYGTCQGLSTISVAKSACKAESSKQHAG